MNTRYALLAVGLAFGIWETVDVVDTGILAAVFAVLFFVCTAWLGRRNSAVAAIVIAVLCAFEASQAHTWKGTGTTAKDAATVLGTTGIAAAAAFLLRSRLRHAQARPPRVERPLSQFAKEEE